MLLETTIISQLPTTKQPTALLFDSFVTMATDPDPIMRLKKGLSW